MNGTDQEQNENRNKSSRQERSLLKSIFWGICIIVVALMLISIFIPVSIGSRPMALRTACAANLKGIATSCLMYAETHGQFPSTLDVLLEGGERAYLLPEEIICPVSKKRYIYIPPPTTQSDPTDVLVYEALGNHESEGGNVAYCGGYARWLSVEKYHTAIDKMRTRLESKDY